MSLSVRLALTGITHQKCVYNTRQRLFPAFVDSESIWKFAGSSFIQSVAVTEQVAARVGELHATGCLQVLSELTKSISFINMIRLLF